MRLFYSRAVIAALALSIAACGPPQDIPPEPEQVPDPAPEEPQEPQSPEELDPSGPERAPEDAR